MHHPSAIALIGLVSLVALVCARGGEPPSSVRCEIFGGIALPPAVLIHWEPPTLGVAILAVEIHRDGEVIAELPPEALEYMEEPLSGPHEYEVWMFPSEEEGFLHGSCSVDYTPPRIGGFRRGDSNVDGQRDISDAVFTLQFLFGGGPAPRCEKSADSDDNGSLELTDAIYLLNFLFLSGPPLPHPSDECDDDRTEDLLGCEEFPPCFHPPPP